MNAFIVAIFGLTYLGMAAGRVPGLKIDRTGIALIGAVVLVASGAISPQGVARAVHFPTLLLLAGLMVLSARFRSSGFYDRAAIWLARESDRPLRLLALTIAVGGALSAVLVNDIVVFAMAPLLCSGVMSRGLDPRPYLFGLAAASNAGSAASLIGNPQNILIGQVGGLDFWSYAAIAAVPAIVSLAIVFACIAVAWRESLAMRPLPATLQAVAFDRSGVAVCFLALFVLLGLFTTPLSRELSALLVAGALMLSRKLPTRQLLDEIDVPLVVLFASLFVINGAFSETGIPRHFIDRMVEVGWSPDRLSFVAPFAVAGSNTIGNVPAVMLLLEVWRDLSGGTLVALAILSTLAGNLLLVGSLANLIVAERAAGSGVRLSFLDHARAGVPIATLSLLFAGAWLWYLGQIAI